MVQRLLGPFNRVEGDLEVRLELQDGVVAGAWVNSPLYRGYENMLRGRHPLDALVMVPRICGICSVSQGVAAARALRALAGNPELPANALLAERLVTACENLADHLTHFYLFFMPDFARQEYQGAPWFAPVHARFRATQGQSLERMLAARAEFLHLMGILAGRWPHTLSLQPGGSTKSLDRSELLQLRMLLTQFRHFLEEQLFAVPLETVIGWSQLEDLARSCLGRTADACMFFSLAAELGLDRVGRGSDRFLSYGDIAGSGAGFWDGALHPLEPDRITEDLTHSWLVGATWPPSLGQTVPEPDKPQGYTWCKAPRYQGEVCETGALARQLLQGQPLLRGLVKQRGGSVFARVLARLLELAQGVCQMEEWVRQLRPGEPWHGAVELPSEGASRGLMEAARGSLGHWISVDKGKIERYQIVAPTTWNFSPRDAAGTPGALEQALVGLPIAESESMPLLVQHVVRSFDPCMVCTVH